MKRELVLAVAGATLLFAASSCRQVERGMGRSLDNANSVVTDTNDRLWGNRERPASSARTESWRTEEEERARREGR